MAILKIHKNVIYLLYTLGAFQLEKQAVMALQCTYGGSFVEVACTCDDAQNDQRKMVRIDNDNLIIVL